MKIRRDPADLCRDAAGALLADLDRRFLADVWIVKAKHRHTGADHIHGRSILRRGFDEIDNALGQTSLNLSIFIGLRDTTWYLPSAQLMCLPWWLAFPLPRCRPLLVLRFFPRLSPFRRTQSRPHDPCDGPAARSSRR